IESRDSKHRPRHRLEWESECPRRPRFRLRSIALEEGRHRCTRRGIAGVASIGRARRSICRARRRAHRIASQIFGKCVDPRDAIYESWLDSGKSLKLGWGNCAWVQEVPGSNRGGRASLFNNYAFRLGLLERGRQYLTDLFGNFRHRLSAIDFVDVGLRKVGLRKIKFAVVILKTLFNILAAALSGSLSHFGVVQ